MSDGTATWRELLVSTSETVSNRTVARWLCETASGCDAREFIDVLDDVVTTRSGLHLESMIRRYLSGEPLQYVIGRWAFRHLDLMVDRRVLIPRPETEQLVDLALRHLNEHRDRRHVVVDLGTGSGAIGLSIVSESPLDSVTVHLTDVSTDALDVARANSAGTGRAARNVLLHQGAWFDALPTELRGKCDVVVSNPPYIAENDSEVEEIVRQWEPAEALFAGDDGLAHVRTIIDEARDWLAEGGLLLIEIGHTQGDAVQALLNAHKYVDAEILRDHAGRVRFARAYAPR